VIRSTLAVGCQAGNRLQILPHTGLLCPTHPRPSGHHKFFPHHTNHKEDGLRGCPLQRLPNFLLRNQPTNHHQTGSNEMACLEAQDREGRLSCWYFRYWAGWLVGHELGMPAPFLVRFTHTMGCQAGHPSNRRCSISARSCLSPPF